MRKFQSEIAKQREMLDKGAKFSGGEQNVAGHDAPNEVRAGVPVAVLADVLQGDLLGGRGGWRYRSGVSSRVLMMYTGEDSLGKR
jgi:hypothetical protein